MDQTEARSRLERARVARFASITPDGRPHLVAITYAVIDDAVVHMVDDKPKTTIELQRLTNVKTNPRASLLVDNYSDDWATLWWVRVDGHVEVDTAGERWERARTALQEKYPQYRDPPRGAAIFLSIDRISHWVGS